MFHFYFSTNNNLSLRHELRSFFWKRLIKAYKKLIPNKINSEVIFRKRKYPIFATYKIEKQFWDMAPEELKEPILMSYQIYMIKNLHSTPANVVTNFDWTKTKNIFDFYNSYRAELNITNLLNLKKIHTALANTEGLHDLSLRFGKIHLTMDYLDGKKYFAAHTDQYAPASSLANQLRHAAFDNIIDNRKNAH